MEDTTPTEARSMPISSASEILDQALLQILLLINKTHDIRSGLIYHWDSRQDKLIGRAYFNKGHSTPITPIAFGKSDTSFANYVLGSQDPVLIDVPEYDPRMDHHRRREYSIDGPVLGIPLKGSEGSKIGVIVLWNRRGDGRIVNPKDKELLKPLASLAAQYIESLNLQLAQADVQARLLVALHKVQDEPDREKALSLVMKCNLFAPNLPDNPLGFDRVRLFLACDDGTTVFSLHSCEGAEPFQIGNSPIVLHWGDNADDSVKSACRTHDPVWIGKSPIRARLAPPKADGRRRWEEEKPVLSAVRTHWFQGHPDREFAEWHCVSIRLGGRMLGLLEADNWPSGRELAPEGFDTLQAMGAIAASVIAHHFLTAKVAAEPMMMLMKFCQRNSSNQKIYRYILTHLTCREGLQHQRAFFMGLSPLRSDAGENQNELVFIRGIGLPNLGSDDNQEHMRISRATVNWSYSTYLERIEEGNVELNEKMKGFRFPMTSSLNCLLSNSWILDEADETLKDDLTNLLAEINTRIGASCLLTVPVASKNSRYGVLFVDNPFDKERNHAGFLKSERSFVEWFAQVLVPLLLERNATTSQVDWVKDRGEALKKLQAGFHALERLNWGKPPELTQQTVEKIASDLKEIWSTLSDPTQTSGLEESQ